MRNAIRLLFLLAISPLANAETPATLRVDYFHSGDATTELYALERVVVEPLPWPGNPARPIDDSNRGMNKFESDEFCPVCQDAVGATIDLYSRP